MKLILFVFSLFVVVIGYRGIAEALDNHSSKQLTWRVVFVYPMDRPLVSHPVSLHSGELPLKNSFKPSFKPTAVENKEMVDGQFFRSSSSLEPLQSADERKFLPYPFRWPLPLFNLLHYTNNQNQAFTRPAVTKLSTITSTIYRPTNTMCVPSLMLKTPRNPEQCRQFDKQDKEDFLRINPTLVQPIESIEIASLDPLITISKKGFENSSLINGSLMEDNPIDRRTPPLKWNFQPTTKTSSVTIYHFRPTVITKTIFPVELPLAGEKGALLCLPQGVTVCETPFKNILKKLSSSSCPIG